jgi:riboflavin transporter FmnP
MRTYYIAGGALFGALAVLIRFLGIKFPFPPIPYLVFEIAEIPILTGFLLYGPTVGIIAAFSYWGILNVVGEFVPIGPAMAFAASTSTIVGIWIGIQVFRRFTKNRIALLSSSVFIGMVLRAIVMTVFNIIILLLIMPFFFEFAANAVASFFGISFATQIDALMVIIVLTALFNIIQVIIIAIPSIALVNAVNGRVMMGRLTIPWLIKMLE